MSIESDNNHSSTFQCTKCLIHKLVSEFPKTNFLKKGFINICKKCTRQRERENRQKLKISNPQKYEELLIKERIRSKEKRAKNPEKYRQYDKNKCIKHAEKIKKRRKIYVEKHKEELLEYQKIYRDENKEKFKQLNKQWRDNNREYYREYRNEYEKNKMLTDNQYYIRRLLKVRLQNALKAQNSRKSVSIIKLCGCSLDYLITYIESLFLPGMTWENKGEWHLDHKIPLASFNLLDMEEQKKACHYTNLRPLWAIDNLKKSTEDKKLIQQKRLERQLVNNQLVTAAESNLF